MPNKNMQESNQNSSNSFIIEISLPGVKVCRLEKQLKRKDLSEALSDSPWHRFLSWHFDQ
jgi:hypothetical protein